MFLKAVRTVFLKTRQQRKVRDNLMIPALIGLNALVLHGMISGTYFFVHSEMYIALLAGILFGVKAAARSSAKN